MSPRVRGKSVEVEVAVVKRDVEQLMQDGLRREEKQEEILQLITALDNKFDALKAEQDKYKGFLGGVLWVLVAMGATILKFGVPIYQWVIKMKTGTP